MRPITLIAAVGTLFSGSLSAAYFARGSCALGCSFLLGLPTCLYGFVLFGALLALSLLDVPWQRTGLLGVAAAGVLFSLWFVVQELAVCVFCYPLGLPNCVYGLLMYAGILWLAWRLPRT